MIMVRIFLGTLLGSSAQVNCVLDKICLDKSPCLTFSVWLLLDKDFLYEFYWRESCQCKCNCGDSWSKFEFCWDPICLQDLWKRSIRTFSRVSRMHGMLASHFSVIKVQWLFRFSRVHGRRLKWLLRTNFVSFCNKCLFSYLIVYLSSAWWDEKGQTHKWC